MMKLIQNIDVYAPQHLGKKDVLMINDKIIKIKDAGSISADGFLSEAEMINGEGDVYKRQIVCLAALCAPLSVFFQRPERQHDMDMRVAGSLVMDSKVGAHSFVYKVVLHIGTHKGKLLFAGQFTG